MSIFDYFRLRRQKNKTEKDSNTILPDDNHIDVNDGLKSVEEKDELLDKAFKVAEKERLKFPDDKILVIGIGGGGINAVARMCEEPIEGVLYGAINYGGYHRDNLNSKIPLKYLLKIRRGGSCIGNGSLDEHNINKEWIRGLLQTNNKKIDYPQKYPKLKQYTTNLFAKLV